MGTIVTIVTKILTVARQPWYCQYYTILLTTNSDRPRRQIRAQNITGKFQWSMVMVDKFKVNLVCKIGKFHHCNLCPDQVLMIYHHLLLLMLQYFTQWTGTRTTTASALAP